MKKKNDGTKTAKLKQLNSKTKPSQCQTVLKHLKRYKKITTIQAFQKYEITRLSGRIYELKHNGNNITTNMVTKNGKTYAEYRLEK